MSRPVNFVVVQIVSNLKSEARCHSKVSQMQEMQEGPLRYNGFFS